MFLINVFNKCYFLPTFYVVQVVVCSVPKKGIINITCVHWFVKCLKNLKISQIKKKLLLTIKNICIILNCFCIILTSVLLKTRVKLFKGR